MKRKEKILLVDDEIDKLETRAELLRDFGYDCITARNGAEAVEIVKEVRPTVVLTDLVMPEKDGIEVLKETKRIDPDIKVILFTGYGTIESAVEAMKAAFDYLQTPFSADQLKIVIDRALNHRKLEEENRKLRSQIRQKYSFDNIIGKSEVMMKVFERVAKVAETDANCLIIGENGTGKELIARSIHANSKRRDEAFVAVDCAIPESLLESELFGYEKGAFTGAYATKMGLLELAHKGTFFLDEICELHPNLQAKLLRVLQERQFRHIGGKKLIDVDIRVISATNRDPQKAIAEGRLREDLYYRLNVIPIELPPLRERREDIPLLVNHFIEDFTKKANGKRVKGTSPEALEYLKNYHWPGNVRELQNVIERVVSLTDRDIILPEDLPGYIKKGDKTLTPTPLKEKLSFTEAKRRYIKEFERQYFEKLLRETKGNISAVARIAKVNRRTVYRIINSLKLSPKNYL